MSEERVGYMSIVITIMVIVLVVLGHEIRDNMAHERLEARIEALEREWVSPEELEYLEGVSSVVIEGATGLDRNGSEGTGRDWK